MGTARGLFLGSRAVAFESRCGAGRNGHRQEHPTEKGEVGLDGIRVWMTLILTPQQKGLCFLLLRTGAGTREVGFGKSVLSDVPFGAEQVLLPEKAQLSNSVPPTEYPPRPAPRSALVRPLCVRPQGALGGRASFLGVSLLLPLECGLQIGAYL